MDAEIIVTDKNLRNVFIKTWYSLISKSGKIISSGHPAYLGLQFFPDPGMDKNFGFFRHLFEEGGPGRSKRLLSSKRKPLRNNFARRCT